MTTLTITTRYDLDSGNRLIPLLSGIIAEIRDRSHSVRILRSRLGDLCSADGSLPSTQQERGEALELRARLATNLRERRLAREELEELGCLYVEGDQMVRIPGASGTMDDGFLWSPGQDQVEMIPGADWAEEVQNS